MNLWTEGNDYNGVDLSKYDTVLANFKGHPAYLQGPNSASFISTYSSGGLHKTPIGLHRGIDGEMISTLFLTLMILLVTMLVILVGGHIGVM